jgi:predicted metal-dependent HD superfamily phosphohydrolase
MIPLSPEWRARILAAYAEPHRHYHTLAHIEHMFSEAARFAPLSPAVEWAIWFHDVVYDPRSHTNEADSARIAAIAMRDCGEPEEMIARVKALILSTRHAGEPIADDETRLLISLDLAILAAPAERYDAYAHAVRQEYAHVPDDAFRAGRAAFIRRFLAQPVLFPHTAFAGADAPARANLERELVALSATWLYPATRRRY